MKTLSRLLQIIVMALALVVAVPAQAATGGVNVDKGCSHQQGWFSYATVLDAHNVYSWRCVIPAAYSPTGISQLKNVDMNNACYWTYYSQTGGKAGWARFTDANNAYSWYCTY